MQKMSTKTISPEDVIWETPHYLMDTPDGTYPVQCSLEMEPVIQDPVVVQSKSTVRVENGWINVTDAAIAVADAVQDVGGSYDRIVGAAFVKGMVQFVVVWEHTFSSAPNTNKMH